MLHTREKIHCFLNICFCSPQNENSSKCFKLFLDHNAQRIQFSAPLKYVFHFNSEQELYIFTSYNWLPLNRQQISCFNFHFHFWSWKVFSSLFLSRNKMSVYDFLSQHCTFSCRDMPSNKMSIFPKNVKSCVKWNCLKFIFVIFYQFLNDIWCNQIKINNSFKSQFLYGKIIVICSLS